jgi:HEAT repeat protein
MNCEEINFILDANASEALTPAQKQTVEHHFASCCECRAAWAAYREIAAERPPAAPPSLASRVAAALAASRPVHIRTLRRSLVIGSLLGIGAAAAATIALQFGDFTPAAPSEQPVSIAAPLADGEPEPAVASSGVERGVDAASPNGPVTAMPTAAQYALDPYSLIVLALPRPTADAQAIAFFDECHAAVVREVSTVDGLNVIAGQRVAPYAGSDLRPEEIARQLGAGSVLILSTADQAMLDQVVTVRAGMGLTSRLGSCLALQLDAQTGAERMSTGRIAPEWDADTARSIAVELTDRVREVLFEDPATRIAAARATVLDATIGDLERVNALSGLRQGPQFSEPLSPSGPDGAAMRSPIPLIGLRASAEPIAGAYDEAVVAATIQIGLTSSSARARQAAWNNLRGVREAQVGQALTTSLANDADENVRRAAALALGYLVDEPGVRAALTRAAAQDPSEQAPVPCCIPSVRDAARRALLSDAELHESALRTVLDATLPSEERLRPLYQSVDGRGFPVQLDGEAARAVFDIGRGTDDALLRARAWDALGDFGNPDFTATLLDDLAGHPAENVRASAASALRPYVDDPTVRAALEQAQADAVVSVRRAAQSALDSGAR